MALNIGNGNIINLYVGENEVDKVCLGGTEVWSKTPAPEALAAELVSGLSDEVVSNLQQSIIPYLGQNYNSVFTLICDNAPIGLEGLTFKHNGDNFKQGNIYYDSYTGQTYKITGSNGSIYLQITLPPPQDVVHLSILNTKFVDICNAIKAYKATSEDIEPVTITFTTANFAVTPFNIPLQYTVIDKENGIPIGSYQFEGGQTVSRSIENDKLEVNLPVFSSEAFPAHLTVKHYENNILAGSKHLDMGLTFYLNVGENKYITCRQETYNSLSFGQTKQAIIGNWTIREVNNGMIIDSETVAAGKSYTSNNILGVKFNISPLPDTDYNTIKVNVAETYTNTRTTESLHKGDEVTAKGSRPDSIPVTLKFEDAGLLSVSYRS